MDLGHMYAEDSEEESDPEELHFIGTQQKPYYQRNRGQASQERINRLAQEGRCFTCEKKGQLSMECPNKKKKGN